MEKRDCVEMEIKYVSMFSKVEKKAFGNITYDVNQRDKYYHNYMHIIFKKKYKKEDLETYFKTFFQFGHAMYRLECQPIKEDFSFLEPYHLDRNGYFFAELEDINIETKNQYEIRKVDDRSKDMFLEHLYQDSKIYGENYAKENAKRQWQVLSEEANYAYYIALDQNHIIGNINVFIDGKYAKVDDFSVLPTYQRQGVGSFLMKSVLAILKDKGVKSVYLVSSMDDTPKEMYQSWGFKLIGTYTMINKVKSESNDSKSS